MENILDKLFSIFEDYKRQNLFEICLLQIIEIYKDSPSSINYILKKTIKLLFSVSSDQRLQLEHRQIASAIIEKTYKNYSLLVQDFVQHYNPDNNKYQDLFCFENMNHLQGIQQIQQTKEGIQQIQQTKDNHQMEIEKIEKIEKKGDKKIKTLQEAKEASHIEWKNIDFKQFFINNDLLLAKQTEKSEKETLNSQQERKKKEDEILQQLGFTSSFNEHNLQSVLDSISGAKIFDKFLEVQSDSEESENRKQKHKKEKKDKKKRKFEEQEVEEEKEQKQIQMINSEQIQKKIKTNKETHQTLQQMEFEHKSNSNISNHNNDNTINDNTNTNNNFRRKIFNPFNLVYTKCLQNLIDSNWEIRHASALVLRGFMKQDISFIGFELIIEQGEIENFQLFIKNKLREELIMFLQNQENMIYKVQDQLSRNLIIIALDRFADYVSDKSNIIVRETSSQIISIIIKESKYFNLSDDELFLIFELLKIFFTQDEWEVQQSSLFLINTIIKVRPDLIDKIFAEFKFFFLNFIHPYQIDDVILAASEALLEFPIFDQVNFQANYEYLDKLNQNICNTIQNLDDITYATKYLLNLLEKINQHGINILLVDGSQEAYLKKFQKLFYHKIREVRNEGYRLYSQLFQNLKKQQNQQNNQTLQIFPFSENVTIRNLMTMAYQAVTIEDNSENYQNACEMAHGCFQLFQIETQIHFLIKISEIGISQESIEGMVNNFSYLSIFTAGSPYTFGLHFQNNNQIMDYTMLRMFKICGFLAVLMNKNLNLQEIMKFQNVLLQELDKQSKKHRILFFLMVIQLKLIQLNPVLVSNMVKIKDTEEILQLEQNELISLELEILDSSIENIIQNNIGVVKNNDHKKIFLEYLSTKQLSQKRKFYEIIYNAINDDQQSYSQLKLLIENYVNQSKDLLISLKTLASCLNIQINNINQINKPPDNLNIVIKPLVAKISKEKFQFFTSIAAESFYLLSKNLKFMPNVQKMIKNTLISFADKSNKQEQFIDFQKEFPNLILVEKYSQKYECINTIFIKFIEELKDQSYERIQILKEIFAVQEKPENNLKLIKIILPSICKLKQQNKEIQMMIDNVCEIMMQQKNNSEHVNKLANKVFQRMLLDIINNGKDSKVQVYILEKYYQMIKNKNLNSYQILNTICDQHIKEFIDFAAIYVLLIVKSLTYDKEHAIQELSFIILGNLITALFLYIQSSAHKPLSEFLNKKMKKGIQFILDFKNPNNFEYPILEMPRADLRNYQIDGIKWLGFLVKYNLNGALCDDMGLGKTLQTLSVIQNEIIKSQQKNNPIQLPTLVVCPPILAEHWKQEIEKFLNSDYVSCTILQNLGVQAQQIVTNSNEIYITSYNNLVRQIDIIKNINFKFCVLDEGHLIKNPKTKVAQAVKQIKSKHKFILSGTPIQNNLQELWSLFDYLMPNYLGNEEIFKKRFQKLFNTNILQFSDDNLVFTDEQNKVLLDLHKRVMPFIMRRNKQQVLNELPQKIIQDYYCYMSEVQQLLYDELQQNEIKDCEKELEVIQNNTSILHTQLEKGNKQIFSNVLQMLQMMLKLVNHPLMINTQNLNENYQKHFNQMKSQLNNYECSGKFQSFKGLLIDLGFDLCDQSFKDMEKNKKKQKSEEYQNQMLQQNVSNIQNKNKILVFSRFKQTFNLLITQVIEAQFGNISYLKLDGDVPQNQKHSIVNLFNQDPTIKILFLTTQVGGLGLNLSSANIVVMFDHDYNPQNDLQAIDRAHRIGQKNVVNVYRLMTKNSLEEKIMGIQKFKLNIANTVINIDNASIKNIKESNIVNLFDNMIGAEQAQSKDQNKDQDFVDEKAIPYKKLLAGMYKEMWEEQDYNKEY